MFGRGLLRNGAPFLGLHFFRCAFSEDRKNNGNPAFKKSHGLLLPPNSTVFESDDLAAMLCSLLHSWCYHRQGFTHRPPFVLRWFQ
jgi:hypothetical protein